MGLRIDPGDGVGEDGCVACGKVEVFGGHAVDDGVELDDGRVDAVANEGFGRRADSQTDDQSLRFGVFDLRLDFHQADGFEHVEGCVDGFGLLPALGTALLGELPLATEKAVVAAHDTVVGLGVLEDADVAGVTPLAVQESPVLSVERSVQGDGRERTISIRADDRKEGRD